MFGEYPDVASAHWVQMGTSAEVEPVNWMLPVRCITTKTGRSLSLARLLVLLAALASVAAYSGPATKKPTSTTVVTIGGRPGVKIPERFLGLSFETSSLPLAGLYD